MGLKRRHKKKHDNFDPKKVVKLNNQIKCYVVDEAPRYPIVAIPRQLQKRFHYYSNSENESEHSDDSNSEESFSEYYVSGNNNLIRMCPIDVNSGFDGGGTAPVDPKDMLGRYIHIFTIRFVILFREYAN